MKAKMKFKEGDQIVCVDTTQFRSKGGSPVSGFWTKSAGIKEGDVRTVRRVSPYGSVMLEGSDFWLTAKHFERVPDVIIVQLRRREDRKSMEDFLVKQGVKLDYSPGSGFGAKNCPVMVVHIKGGRKGNVNYNGQVKFGDDIKYCVRETIKWQRLAYGYEQVLVVKTKPSVNKAKAIIKNLL